MAKTGAGTPFADDDEDGESLYFWHYNTSKRSVVLDLEKAAAKEAFLALVASADVLIESEAPGRLAALGVDYADLVRVKPDLIQVSVTPFGRETSRRDEPATDLTSPPAVGPPGAVAMTTLDPADPWGGNQGYQTASHYAVMSALALPSRRREGQFIDVTCTPPRTSRPRWLLHVARRGRRCSADGRHAMPMMPVQIQCKDGRCPTGMPRAADSGRSTIGRTARPRAQLPERPSSTMRAIGNRSVRHIGVDDEVTAAFAAARVRPADRRELDGRRVLRGRTEDQHHRRRDSLAEEAMRTTTSWRGAIRSRSTTPSETPGPLPGAPTSCPRAWRISRRAPALGEHAAEVFGPLGIDAVASWRHVRWRRTKRLERHASIEEAARFPRCEPGTPEIERTERWIDRNGSAVWDRPGLTRAEASTISIMSVLRDEQLRVHVELALANGLPTGDRG